MNIPRYRAQRGVALISVLLIFALVVVLASDIARRQYMDLRSTGNLLGMRQAQYYALGGESWARQILYRDRAETERDGLTESWAEERRFEPDNGEMIVTIQDAQGLFNLNNLVDDNGVVVSEQLMILRRLLNQLKLSQNLAERIADWIDSDDRNLNGSGTESFSSEFRPANMRLAHPSELRALGLSAEDYATLLPHIATLPEQVALNVNTLDAAVISALASGVGQGSVARISARQRAGGYTSVSEFEADLGRGLSSGLVGLESKYFQVNVVARFTDYVSHLQSVVQRKRDNNKTQIQIIRRDYGAQ